MTGCRHWRMLPAVFAVRCRALFSTRSHAALSLGGGAQARLLGCTISGRHTTDVVATGRYSKVRYGAVRCGTVRCGARLSPAWALLAAAGGATERMNGGKWGGGGLFSLHLPPTRSPPLDPPLPPPMRALCVHAACMHACSWMRAAV